MGVKFLEVTSEDEGQRVDNFLMRHYRNVPKTLIYRIIRKGEVRVNKGRVKQNTRLADGDVVRVPPIKVPEKPSPPCRPASYSALKTVFFTKIRI